VNDLAQIPELLPFFDRAINEQCFPYDDREPLNMVVEAGPVRQVERCLPL